MQRFGFNLTVLFLTAFLFAMLSCNPKLYNDNDMAPLTTLSRVVMGIVKSNYLDKPVPAEISEDEIKTIVNDRGKALDALDQLSQYDIKNCN